MTNADLPDPWPEVFLLMWEAYAAGTIPVGAVITDQTGAVVSRGRNRIFNDESSEQLGRSRLAHAEINALLQLSSQHTYETYTLYSALEPCHLCLSAAISTRVGSLEYASSDSYGGAIGKLLPSRDHEAHPLNVSGPLEGPAGRLPEMLLVAHMLWRVPKGDVAGFYRRTNPDLVVEAKSLPNPDSDATLDDLFAMLG